MKQKHLFTAGVLVLALMFTFSFAACGGGGGGGDTGTFQIKITGIPSNIMLQGERGNIKIGLFSANEATPDGTPLADRNTSIDASDDTVTQDSFTFYFYNSGGGRHYTGSTGMYDIGIIVGSLTSLVIRNEYLLVNTLNIIPYNLFSSYTATPLTGSVSIGGTPQMGQVLTANTSNLGGSGTVYYQWKRGDSANTASANILNANSSTYTLTTADLNKYITVTVNRSGNSGSVTSTTAIGPVTNNNSGGSENPFAGTTWTGDLNDYETEMTFTDTDYVLILTDHPEYPILVGTYTNTGNTATLTGEDEDGEFTFTVTISGNNLTVDFGDGDTFTFTKVSGGGTPVTFSGVTANGSASQTTTQLTLTFSAAITGLSAADITLSGVSGVSKGTFSGSGPSYTLPISGFAAGGTLSVAVGKTGYTISGSPQSVTIYYSGTPIPPGPNPFVGTWNYDDGWEGEWNYEMIFTDTTWTQTSLNNSEYDGNGTYTYNDGNTATLFWENTNESVGTATILGNSLTIYWVGYGNDRLTKGGGRNTDPKRITVTGITSTMYTNASEGFLLGIYPTGTTQAEVINVAKTYLTGTGSLNGSEIVAGASDADIVDMSQSAPYSMTVQLKTAPSFASNWTRTGTYDIWFISAGSTNYYIYKMADISIINATTTIAASATPDASGTIESLFESSGINLTPLTEKVWVKDRRLNFQFDEDWYSFSVISGTTYRIWWHDKGQGNKTKTGDVVVGARYSSSSTWIFGGTNNTVNDGYTYAQSFTASQTGTVVIRVIPLNRSSNCTGTYDIVYSKDIRMPAL
jgi:hypothetical protein